MSKVSISLAAVCHLPHVFFTTTSEFSTTPEFLHVLHVFFIKKVTRQSGTQKLSFHLFGRCSFALLFSHPLIWASVIIVRGTHTRTFLISKHKTSKHMHLKVLL